MTKKELAELRKQYQKEASVITRIRGCYVNEDAEPVATFGQSFGSLPDEDGFKYCDLLKKVLSGTAGKQLFALPFPLQEEEDGGTQSFLLELRNSRLTDDTLLEEFYSRVRNAYSHGGNYLILLAHHVYDIPGRSSDGSIMEDASDLVFEYLVCAICPVSLSKPGLSFHSEHARFENASREWMAGAPDAGFTFPAFTDRNTDIHTLWYFQKKADTLQEAFLQDVFGVAVPTPAPAQKEAFCQLAEQAFGDTFSYVDVLGLQESLTELSREDESRPLGKWDLKVLFRENGIPEEQFLAAYEAAVPDEAPLLIQNTIGTNKIAIQSQGIKIQAKPEQGHLLSVKKVDGRNCLVIVLEGELSVNGIALPLIRRPGNSGAE